MKQHMTKILATASLAATAFMAWMMDPANLAAVQTLLRGHARLLSILTGGLYLWNLMHQPGQTQQK